jgi:hypothetical protein
MEHQWFKEIYKCAPRGWRENIHGIAHPILEMPCPSSLEAIEHDAKFWRSWSTDLRFFLKRAKDLSFSLNKMKVLETIA